MAAPHPFHPPHTRSRRRRASSTLESILVLLVLVLASFAVFQFGIALIVKQAVSHAATVAAREAGKGATADELVSIVDRVLAGHRIAIGPHAALVREDGTAPDSPEFRGALDCQPLESPALDAGEVRVSVCVSLAAPPFINLLKHYGIDFAGKQFVVRSVAIKE